MADFWELVSGSPAGGVEGVVTEASSVDAQLDQRHLMLRGDIVSHVTGMSCYCDSVSSHLSAVVQGVSTPLHGDAVHQRALLQPRLRGSKVEEKGVLSMTVHLLCSR